MKCKHLNGRIVELRPNALKAVCDQCGMSTETSEEVPPKWVCRLLRKLVLDTFVNNRVHLSGGGRDPNARIYTKADVEALVTIGLAAANMKRPSAEQQKGSEP